MKSTNELSERWSIIDGFESYEVSDIGRVRSNINPKKPKILKQYTDEYGYNNVMLTNKKGSGKFVNKSVHRLVAAAFIPNPENKPCVDHINTIRDDNRVENLRWCTSKENASNPITKERVKERAESQSQMVLVYDMDFNLLSAFTSTAETARQLGLSQGNIVNCCLGSLSSYHNMYFSYIPLTKEVKKKIDESGEEKRKKRIKSINKAVRGWQERNRDYFNSFMRNYYYQKKYGMSETEYKQQKKNKIDGRKEKVS